MNVHSQTTSAIRRAHESLSRDVEVHNFVFDPDAGSNEYADGEWVDRDDYPRTVSATIRSTSNSEDISGPEGADVAADVAIYVDPTETDVEIGNDDETRATEFVDSESGRRYKTLDLHHQQSLIEVFCEVL